MKSIHKRQYTPIFDDLCDKETITVDGLGEMKVTMVVVYTYCYILRLQEDDKCAFFSRETLSRRLGVNVKTLDKTLKEMAKFGLIKINHRPGTTSLYRALPWI